MTELSEHEYKELKEFLSFYSSRYMSIDRMAPELRPVACLEILEKKSGKLASRGLRQAINDIIEMSRNTDHGQVGKIDSELKRQNIVTLSELRRRFSKDYARIVRRGKINNETQYYLIRNMIDDAPADVNDALGRMIAEFEEKSVMVVPASGR